MAEFSAGIAVRARRARLGWLPMLGWLLALAGLAVVGWLLGGLAWPVPADAGLALEQIRLPDRATIIVTVSNRSAEPLTVAQVQVDHAYWSFSISPQPTLAPRGRATITLPYRWVQNDRHELTLVTSDGATFSGQIEQATLGAVSGSGAGWPGPALMPALVAVLGLGALGLLVRRRRVAGRAPR